MKKYPKATFDKEIAFKNPDAEFISFGHPLFEYQMVWIERHFSESLLNGATFTDPDGSLDGYILFYEDEIRDGTGEIAGKRLFSFFINEKELRPISPAIIWDLAEGDKPFEMGADLDLLKRNASNSVILKLEEYKKDLLKERNRHAAIKEKYGIKSLEYLIWKLDGDLIAFYDRKNQGENLDLVIRNIEERKNKYDKALNELKELIDKEKSLTMTIPHFIGIISVKPAINTDKDFQSDPEIERIGMQVAMDYETKNRRRPEDVSSENLGFDIRSADAEKNLRYIEVKARSESGPVALTQNEWFKARRFKEDYYLYAVMNAATNPELYVVRNPAENLHPNEKVEVVRYVVPFEELKRKRMRD